jgi:hypothetical protein
MSMSIGHLPGCASSPAMNEPSQSSPTLASRVSESSREDPSSQTAAALVAPAHPFEANGGSFDAWRQLFVEGANWELPCPDPTPPAEVSVESVRTVDGVHVARLTGMELAGHLGYPVEVVVARDGLRFVYATMGFDGSDTATRAVLQDPPVLPFDGSPIVPGSDGYPSATKTGGETILCIGYASESCDDVCYAEFCVSSIHGVTRVGGWWAPGQMTCTGP